jgi:hypothetical protein
MKFPRFLRVTSLLAYAIFFGLGVVLCAFHPEIPKKVMDFIHPPVPQPPPKPTLNQINEVLSGSLALVEAQHTYYVHVMHNTKFAANIRELGSRDEKGGTVMVHAVWNASDAAPKPTPINGYIFKSLPVIIGPDKNDGLVICAYPADQRAEVLNWPLFLSIIPDAKGGLISMSSADTWEVEDPVAAKEIRALLQRDKLASADLTKFSPTNSPKSFLIENFKKAIP